MKLQNSCGRILWKPEILSLKKQYKGIRPLGRLASIKHDDLDAAPSSRGPYAADLQIPRGRTGEGSPYAP